MTREMLSFTIETAVDGHVRAMVGYARAMVAPLASVRSGPHCNGGSDVLRKSSVRTSIGEWQLQIARRLLMVG